MDSNYLINEYENSAGFHIVSARRSFEETEVDDQAVRDCLFHIEQCIETAIKSLILCCGYDISEDRNHSLTTHRIIDLINLYEEVSDGLYQIPDFIRDNCTQITEWAIDPRYFQQHFDIIDLATVLEDTENFYYDVYDILEGF